VLLEGSSVGAGARVRRSVLAPGAEAPPGASLEGVVAGEDERVPS
jgi:valienol-1-phosphate guanylyltransferase